MKYTNANNVLPEELVALIQEYVQGEYLYIPMREKSFTESPTEYKTELEKRDAHIYRRHLEGVDNKRLARIYNLSESSIRRIVIKQRKGYKKMPDKIRTILKLWGMTDQNIKQIYDTTWQIGEGHVLKVYQDKEGLERNIKVLQILEQMKIPVGKIVPANAIEPYVQYEDKFYFLSEKLQGKNIIQIGNDKKLAGKMGGIIADLHLAFAKCDEEDSFWNNSLLEEMNGWVKQNFEDLGWEQISRAEYEEVVKKLETLYDELPVQLIHRDVHFGNFLFEEGEFSGYIDFDLSQRNIRIFDLCYFMLGLLSEKEKFELTEELWFAFLQDVFQVYQRKVQLTEAEKKAVPYVMECIELLFVSYFASIKDVACANSAFEIFAFVKKHEEKIWKNI